MSKNIKDMGTNELLDVINSFGKIKKNKQLQLELQREKQLKDKIDTILSFNINQTLQLGIAIVENELTDEFEQFQKKFHSDDKCPSIFASSYHHNVGLITKPHSEDYALGIEGGTNEKYNLIVEKDKIYYTDRNTEDIILIYDLWYLGYFLQRFPKFEADLLDFVAHLDTKMGEETHE